MMDNGSADVFLFVNPTRLFKGLRIYVQDDLVNRWCFGGGLTFP